MPTNLLHPVYHGHSCQLGSRTDIDRLLPVDPDDEDLDEWIEKLSEPPRYHERIAPVSTLINTDLVRGKNWTEMMIKAHRVFLRIFTSVSFYIRQALVEKFGERGMVPFMSYDLDPDALNRIIELDYEQGENTYGTIMELFRSATIAPAATVPFHVIVPLLDNDFDRRLVLRIGLLVYWDIVKVYHETIRQTHGDSSFVLNFWLPECGYCEKTLRILYEEFMAMAKRDRIANPHLVLMLDNQQALERDTDVLMKSWNMVQAGPKETDRVSVVFRDRGFSEWTTYSNPSVKKLIDRTIAKVDSDLNEKNVDYGWGHFEEVEALTFNSKSATNFEQKIVKLAQLSYMSVSPDMYVRRKMNGKFRSADHEPQIVQLRNNTSWSDWHPNQTLGRWQGILDSNAPFPLVDENRPYIRRTRTGKVQEPGPQAWKVAFNKVRQTCTRHLKGDPETMKGGFLEILAGICGAKDTKIVHRNVADFLAHFSLAHWREHFLQHDRSEADCDVRELVDSFLVKDVKKRLKDEDYFYAAVAAQGYYFALDAHRSYATAYENMDNRAVFQCTVMLVLSACNLIYLYHWLERPADAKRVLELIKTELFDFPSAYERYRLADYGITEQEWLESIRSGIDETNLNVVVRAARRTAYRHLRPLGYRKEFTREDENITTNTSHIWSAEVENTNYKWENKLFCGLREE